MVSTYTEHDTQFTRTVGEITKVVEHGMCGAEKLLIDQDSSLIFSAQRLRHLWSSSFLGPSKQTRDLPAPGALQH